MEKNLCIIKIILKLFKLFLLKEITEKLAFLNYDFKEDSNSSG